MSDAVVPKYLGNTNPTRTPIPSVVIDVFATKQIFRFVKEHSPNTVPELGTISLKIPQGTSDRRIQVRIEFGR